MKSSAVAICFLILISIYGVIDQGHANSEKNFIKKQPDALGAIGPNATDSLKPDIMASSSYITKGITYLGIAGILILIWIFLRYKIE